MSSRSKSAKSDRDAISGVLREMERTSSFVSDLDGTLCHGRLTAGGMGFRYLDNDVSWPWNAHNYPRALRGIIGIAKIKFMLKKGAATAETDGIKLLYDILVQNGLGERSEMLRYAWDYMLSHKIDSVVKLVANIPENKFRIIATLAGSTGAQVAKSHLDFHDFVSNIDTFDARDRLTGITILMRTGEDKARCVGDELIRKGLHLKRSAVIGDGPGDIPMLMEAKVKIASPDAKPEVLAIPGIMRL